jgi:beta-propeller repeat-containing protein
MNLKKALGWSLILIGVLPGNYSAYDAKGKPAWIRQLGSSAGDSANGVAADRDGNIFIAGETGGANAGESDAFVAKYDANGNRPWIQQLGSDARDSANGVSVDVQGDIYIAGLTFGSMDGTNAGKYDAFIAKYDADGNHLWTKQLGGSLGDYAASVSTDPDGNAYIAGDTFDSLDGVNAGVADAYLAKYDSDGNRLWIRQLGSSAGEVARSISSDNSGHVYIAGQTDGGLDGTNTGESDAFLAKYDTDGNRLWIKQLGSPSVDYATGISAHSNGGVYITGITNGSLEGSNAGGYDAFLARYDADGNRLWVTQLGSDSDDFANGISTDSSGLYIAGNTAGSLDGTNGGGYDAFLARYDSEGKRLWVSQLGSDSDEMAKSVSASSGNVFIAGITKGSLEGTNAGGLDAFLAEYNQSLVPD